MKEDSVMARNNDGLVGMWGHAFDEDGWINLQFQVLKQAGNCYVVQVNSFKDGKPSNCQLIPISKLAEMKFYDHHLVMGEALTEQLQERAARQQRQRLAIRSELSGAAVAGHA
jgi:hypothetical protein